MQEKTAAQVLLTTCSDCKTHEKLLFVTDPTSLPEGCAFAPRCQSCMEICKRQAPPVIDRDGHRICCHLFGTEGEGKA